MRYLPEHQAASIVLLGKFNPAIFSPAWLAKAGTITAGEADSATIQVIHPEIAQFSVERFRFDVQKERFQITTLMEPFIRISDSIRTLFTDRLPHTPTSRMGINYELHFRLDSPEQRVALGRALAPIAPWGDFGVRLMGGDAPKSIGGLATLAMQESSPPDRASGYRRVQIEPLRQAQQLSSVRMHINDHYEIPDAEDHQGAVPLMELLNDRFDPSISEAKAIVTQLMEFASNVR